MIFAGEVQAECVVLAVAGVRHLHFAEHRCVECTRSAETVDAEGIVAAAKEVQLSVPMVVRLQGTNGDLGKKILKDSNLKIIAEDDLSKAAASVVKAVKEAA